MSRLEVFFVEELIKLGDWQSKGFQSLVGKSVSFSSIPLVQEFLAFHKTVDEFGEGVHLRHLPGPGSIEEGTVATASSEGLGWAFVADIKNVRLPVSYERQIFRRSVYPYPNANMAILGTSGCWERINGNMCEDI